MKKIKKEVYKWINTKLSIILDLSNLEEQRSLSIPDKSTTLWGKRLKREDKKGKKDKKKRNSRKNSSEKKPS